eukprot:2734002-Pleurochrysis_carterae.AAC.1
MAVSSTSIAVLRMFCADQYRYVAAPVADPSSPSVAPPACTRAMLHHVRMLELRCFAHAVVGRSSMQRDDKEFGDAYLIDRLAAPPALLHDADDSCNGGLCAQVRQGAARRRCEDGEDVWAGLVQRSSSSELQLLQQDKSCCTASVGHAVLLSDLRRQLWWPMILVVMRNSVQAAVEMML